MVISSNCLFKIFRTQKSTTFTCDGIRSVPKINKKKIAIFLFIFGTERIPSHVNVVDFCVLNILNKQFDDITIVFFFFFFFFFFFLMRTRRSHISNFRFYEICMDFENRLECLLRNENISLLRNLNRKKKNSHQKRWQIPRPHRKWPSCFNRGHQRCNFIKGYTCLTLQWVITPQL